MSRITTAGLGLIAQCQAAGQTVAIDTFIYANIPGLDPEALPPATEDKPAAEYIVHESQVTQSGVAGTDTVVYSNILDSSIGDFSFNWIGLWSSTQNVLFAVVYVPEQTKRSTAGWQMGDTLVKNFAVQFSNAPDITGITINVETWQWDFSELFATIDHNHDDAYEPIGAVDNHNNAENPHPDKFAAPHDHPYEASGAVAAHNAAANPHSQYTGYPDWSAGADRAASTDYTATASGWILIGVNKTGDGSADCYMTINGSSVLIGRPGFYNTNTQPTMYLPIKAGDTYRYDIPAGTALAVYKFYPNR